MRSISKLLILLAVTAACGTAGEVVQMPPSMVGTWSTDDARYEGRFFEISPTTLVIGTGDGRATSYSVTALYLTQDEQGRDVHRVDYVDAGTTQSMAFYFSATEPGGALRMRNQPTIVWRKSRG